MALHFSPNCPKAKANKNFQMRKPCSILGIKLALLPELESGVSESLAKA